MVVTAVDREGLALLADQRGVRYVEPEPIIHLPRIQELTQAEMAGSLPASPTDPAGAFFFPRQWHMRAIQAHQAWDAGHVGSEDVTVAILDTGIDYTHADLAGRVDLSRSVSLRPEDDPYVAYYFPGKHPVTDIGYHGTHVAATVVSNGYAAAGVTSRTTLIGVKTCSVVAEDCRNIFLGLDHAIRNGADIINMSLGGGFNRSDYPGYVSVINRYINYTNRMGILLVVSAGNEALDLDHDKDGYKTYCSAPHAVCVSATGPTTGGTTGPWPDADAPAIYTNFGRSAISVAAPGGNTGASVWAACSGTSLLIPVCQTGNYVVGLGGTSMAAPHVTGLAAMIMAEEGTGNPGRVMAIIQNSADDLGQRGRDPFYGSGRINAAGAMGIH